MILKKCEEKQRNEEVCSKKRFRHQNYKNCLLNKETISKPEQRFKIEAHNIYTE